MQVSGISAFGTQDGFPRLAVSTRLLATLADDPGSHLFVLRARSHVLYLIHHPAGTGRPTLRFRSLGSCCHVLIRHIIHFCKLRHATSSIKHDIAMCQPRSTCLQPLIGLSSLMRPRSTIPPSPGRNIILDSAQAGFIVVGQTTRANPTISRTHARAPSGALRRHRGRCRRTQTHVFTTFGRTRDTIASCLTSRSSVRIETRPPRTVRSERSGKRSIIRFKK